MSEGRPTCKNLGLKPRACFLKETCNFHITLQSCCELFCRLVWIVIGCSGGFEQHSILGVRPLNVSSLLSEPVPSSTSSQMKLKMLICTSAILVNALMYASLILIWCKADLHRGASIESGAPSQHCFRGHVVDGADLRLSGDAGCVALNGLRNAKVYQLQGAFHHQEIGRLQVAVDNPRIMNGVHSLSKAPISI